MSGAAGFFGSGSAPRGRGDYAGPPPPPPGGDLHRQQQQQQRKRNRIRFSCTTCRDKKLKCNRLLPCDQCEKRGLGPACRYVPYLYPRDEGPSSGGQTSLEPEVLLQDGTILNGAPQPQQALPRMQQHAYQQPLFHGQQHHYQHHDSRHHAHHHDQNYAEQHSHYTMPHRVSHGDHQHGQDATGVTVQERIRYLEHLVAILKAQTGEAPPNHDEQRASANIEDTDCLHDTLSKELDSLPPRRTGSPDPLSAKVAEAVGRIVGDSRGDSRYVDSANWEGVLDDIVKLTEDLVVDNDDSDDDTPEPDHWDLGPQTNSLALLSGGFPRVSIGEVFRYLPPRPITDLMVARFFQGKEPSWMIFHQPTFYRQYEFFWREPRSASYSYLALLFMMLAHAAIFCLRGDEPVPGGLGDALDVIDACRNRAAHCLALDDYTRPGKYKVETMALYFGTEYLRQADAPLGTAMVLSITLRLAMHMGYHRDPTHFPALTPFEGEMRRRTWALLTEIDKIVSFEFGLPANAKAEDCDTAQPRNLYDADLDEDVAALPPSRPETERTPTLYTICKARIMAVFGDIVVMRMSDPQLGGGSRNHYEDEVLVLDKRLSAAHAALAEPFRYRGAPPPAQVVVPKLEDADDDDDNNDVEEDPVELLMQRYLLELLYQKSRLVLHRRFLGVARTHARYAYSRWVCVDAATRILRHQYDIYVAMQPGGRLSRERWFLTSTSTHDFLLADMVLCLEVSYARKERAGREKSTRGRETSMDIPEQQLLDLLRTSRRIWETQRQESAEANRAFKILSQMLTDSTGDAYEGGSGSGSGMDKGKEVVMTSSSPSQPVLTTATTMASETSISPVSTGTTLYEYPTGTMPTSVSSWPGLPDISTAMEGVATTDSASLLPHLPPMVPAMATLTMPDLPTMPAMPILPSIAEFPVSSLSPADMIHAGPITPGASSLPPISMPIPVSVPGYAVPVAAGPAGWTVPVPVQYTSSETSVPVTAVDAMDGTADPSYVADWVSSADDPLQSQLDSVLTAQPLWDNQIQRANVDAMQTTWNEFFPRGEMHDGQGGQ